MKKIILALVAFCIVLLPAISFAAVSKSSVNGYMNLVNRYTEFKAPIDADATKFNANIDKITSSSVRAKTQKKLTLMNQYLAFGQANLNTARTLLEKPNISKSQFKAARKNIAAAKKYINRAYALQKTLNKIFAGQHIAL
jgi:hypothetical protein